MSTEWRHDLPWFQLEMAKKLGAEKNEAKPSYLHEGLGDLLWALDHEVNELKRALYGIDSSREEQIAECADIANFAMMFAANARREIGREGRVPL